MYFGLTGAQQNSFLPWILRGALRAELWGMFLAREAQQQAGQGKAQQAARAQEGPGKCR